VASLDIDQFKRVNDSLGHPAGDELLRAIGVRLRDQLRDGDTLARFAGDEFVVVWPSVDGPEEAERLAARLTEALAEPFVLRAATVAVTASVGIAVSSATQTAEELVQAADAAMYDAKSGGWGRTRMFTAELRQGADRRLRTELELREGLRDGHFVLHYQPVVDLHRGQVTGVEALVRWAHPDGLRMPDDFIPVAEATGLIVPLGAWVLREACCQAAAWAEEGLDLLMAVNMSARQVSDPAVIDAVVSALSGADLHAGRLLVEVTESTVVDDAELAQVALQRIADLGVGVAIDDFGTGYSSLLYLKRYPISALKVDRHFVGGMGGADDDDAIVASVVGLARAVGAVCIAEGVETMEQHIALQALGCDYAQGYLFGRPVPAHELPEAVEWCAQLLARPVLRKRRARTPVPPLPGPLLQRIAELHSSGGSLHTIAAALNGEDRLHPSGRRWHSATVAKVVASLDQR
jgi:diguanylate cyclase (GGDEF)-like protein